MAEDTILQSYFTNIETVLIDRIKSANVSVRIIMAWLTSPPIINALINLKIKKQQVEIEIVVDSNDINSKYFLQYEDSFVKVGIKILRQKNEKFLHQKIMVIDHKIVILGSYNYTRKARSNRENIAVIQNDVFAATHSRYFDFLTKENYVDENIKLLYKYPEFAKGIVCAYYDFTREEFKKYKDKIVTGTCFTHENGQYDEIQYSPGFIFNKKVKYMKNLPEQEFPVPINKERIKGWIKSRNEDLIFEYYRLNQDQLDSIGDDLDKNEEAVERFYSAKIESTYSLAELESQVQKEVDVIVKDNVWQQNFELFLDKNTVKQLFNAWPVIERPKKRKFPF